MRRPQPQPPAAGAAIGAEHEAIAGAAETGAEAKTGAAETAGAAETGTPEQPQPAPPPKPPSMITPPEEGTELITGAPIEGAPNDGPIDGAPIDGAPNDGPTAGPPIDGPIADGAAITDSPIAEPIADVAPPQLLTNTGT